MSDPTATTINDALAALSAAVHATTQRYADNPLVLGMVLDALTSTTRQIEGTTTNFAAAVALIAGNRHEELP